MRCYTLDRMSTILEGLQNRTENVYNEEKLKLDPVLGDLFTTYLEGKGPTDKVQMILQTDAAARSEDDKKSLQGYIKEFSELDNKAKDLLGIINERNLMPVLEGSVPNIPKGSFALYLRGISVRTPGAFETLRENLIRNVESGIFNRDEETKTKALLESIKQRAYQHGISSSRLESLMQISDASKRKPEIDAAMGGAITSTEKRFLRKATTKDLGEELNEEITKYRAAIDVASARVSGFVSEFNKKDTSAEFFKKIPDILTKKNEKLPPDQRAFTHDQVQQMLTPANRLSELEKTIADLCGKPEATKFKAMLKDPANATWDDVKDKTLSLKGGGTIDIEDLQGKTASRLEGMVTRRGYVSELIKLIMESLVGTGTKDTSSLFDEGKKKYQ